MDMDHSYWEENSNTQLLKYESCADVDESPLSTRPKDEALFRCCDSNLNFATVACSEDDTEYAQYKKNKVSRQDPMSHRIIEKRRRDRMNNCLADLSRLIPADYLKKGRGRIEKTEIIEMAIKHIKYLQQIHRSNSREEPERGSNHEQYRLGYQECMFETMRFLVEVEGYFAQEALCARLINHLQKHCDDLLLQERAQKSTLPSEKDFSHLSNLSQMPNMISPMNPIIHLQTQQEYDNSSQLKDILAGQIKDEIPDMHRDIRIGEYKKMESHKKEEMKEDGRECSNGASLYKFKNNIKQRFNQDLNETNQLKVFKRRKLSEPIRRNSVTTETYSSENHSSPMDSSQCSPPSSEFRISSESENARISPTGSSVSDNRRYTSLKPDSSSTKSSGRYSPLNKYPLKSLDAEKTNFGVPIFALHAKGSFYIPLTIDYHTLVPYLQHNNVLDVLPNVHNIILHPVTINVNFQSNYFNAVTNKPNKTNKSKNDTQNGWH